MDNIVDFIHYAHTGDIVPVKACDEDGHNYRHVSTLEYGEKLFIFCHMCRESAVILDVREIGAFMLNQKNICNRPYHHSSNIRQDGEEMICGRCNVVVRIATHPSHKGENWYG